MSPTGILPTHRAKREKIMKTKTLWIALVVTFASYGLVSAEWSGQQVEENGVPHLKNSEKAVTSVRVELEELWERGGEDDDVLFGRLSQLVQDADGNLYVLDSQLSEIQVFSPSGEFLRTVGREGEGPGEFAAVSDMYLAPNGLLGLLRVFPGRIYQIGTDGAPADFFALPETEGFQLVFVGRATADRILIAGAIQTRENGKQIQTSYIKAFNVDGNELAHFCDQAEETQFGGMKFDEKKFSDFVRRWAVAGDGRVAVAMEFDDYTIDVYNPDGTLDRVIERPEHEPVARTGEQKDRFQKFFSGITRWNPNSTFEVSDTHAAVARLWFRDNGNLWVLPNRGQWAQEDGVFASIDEYDREGRFMRRVDIIVEGDAIEDGVYFLGDRMYRVTDLFSTVMAALGGDDADEAGGEPLRIVAYQLELPELGMK